MLPFLKALRLAAVLLSGLVQTVAAQAVNPAADVNFTPYRNNLSGRYGFLDRNGIEVIGATFDRAESFTEGYAPVVVNDRTGYINSNGTVVIAPKFHGAEHFHEGLALAWRDGTSGKYGYVDRAGNFVLAPQFDLGDWESRRDTRYFSEGLAPFTSKDKWGFIDRAGHVAIGPTFTWVSSFSMGIATVTLPSEGNPDNYVYALIDNKGRYIIPPGVAYLGRFSEGFVVFGEHSDKGDRYGYLSADGKIAIPASFTDADGFHEGLARVRTSKTGLYGFIGRDGKLVIPESFKTADNFSDGVARVQSNSSGRDGFDGPPYGFIDHSGNYRISERYVGASSFVNGLANVILLPCGLPEFFCGTVMRAFIRPDGTNAYVWSDVKIRVPPSCSPCFGGTFFRFTDPPLLTVSFSSLPQGAQVFAVPYSVYDFDKTIGDSLFRLRPFAIITGKTDVTTKLFSQRYHVIFRMGDKRSEMDFDLFKDGPSRIAADFQ